MKRGPNWVATVERATGYEYSGALALVRSRGANPRTCSLDEIVQHVLAACEIARSGAPWWHAWLQAHHVPGVAIAEGIRVSRDRRGDIWLGFGPGEFDAIAEMRPTGYLRGIS